MPTWYVDGDNGDDYDGADIIDAVYDDLGHVDGDYQIEKVGAFTNVAAGDVIYLDDNGSGNITAGYYTVATVPDADSCTLTASAGADAVDVVLDDHTGASEAEAWRTIAKATRMAASLDTIYVQNNGATVYTRGAAWEDKSLNIIGYGSVITDNTRFELDGTASGETIGISVNMATNAPWYVCIRNAYVHSFASHGIYINRTGGSGNPVTFCHNCKVHSNVGTGIYCDATWALQVIQCDVRLNGGDGVRGDAELVVGLSRICDNAGIGINAAAASFGVVFASEVAKNATNMGNVFVGFLVLTDAADGTDNLVQPARGQYVAAALSTFVSCGFSNATAWGIDPGADSILNLLGCGFYNNTSGDVDGTPEIEIDSVTGSDPLYATAASFDFSLGPASPWRQQDIALGLLDSDEAMYADIGAQQMPDVPPVPVCAPLITGPIMEFVDYH